MRPGPTAARSCGRSISTASTRIASRPPLSHRIRPGRPCSTDSRSASLLIRGTGARGRSGGTGRHGDALDMGDTIRRQPFLYQDVQRPLNRSPASHVRMVDEELAAMARLARFSRWGAFVGGAALLALAGCAKDPSSQAGGPTLTVGSVSLATPGSPQDFVANVGDRVFFDTDSTDLTAQGKATLDAQAAWLNKYTSLRFTVEGHADERGTREYNIALGARRATNVKDYLVSRGVAAN